MEEINENKSIGYAKRPLWQWVLMYAAIGVVVCGFVYYFVIMPKGGGYQSPNTSQPATSTQQ